MFLIIRKIYLFLFRTHVTYKYISRSEMEKTVPIVEIMDK